ncbi:hypothetical protein C1X73_32650, partial [Pseudomonas sp. FW305-130]
TQIALDLGALTLSVEIEGTPTALLVEQPLRAIPLEPNLYVDQGDPAQGQAQVYACGVPAGAGITVTMTEIGSTENNPLTATTDANGRVSFPLKTSAATVTGLVFQPGNNPTLPVTPNTFNPQVFT